MVWCYVTAQGLRAMLERRYAEHGEWMVRSYALTFAAVTLRLYLPLTAADGLRLRRGLPRHRLPVSWVPNLMLAELWIASRAAAAHHHRACLSARA